MFATARGVPLLRPFLLPSSPFPLLPSFHCHPLPSRTLLPHGLVEHKARSILDPALYSERYIEHGPSRLPNAAGRVCRHHSSGCCGSTLCILDQMFCPASACPLRMSLDEAGGVYEVGGSLCWYISGSELQGISTTTVKHCNSCAVGIKQSNFPILKSQLHIHASPAL